MADNGWSEDVVEELKDLWRQGRSAAQIARALGVVSRSAVIGKVHRLGLAGRASPSRSERPRLPMAPGPSTLPPRAPEVPCEPAPPMVLESGDLVSMMEISDRMCRWPIGEPMSPDFHFCGHPPKPGHPYCEPHCRRAYQAPRPSAPDDQAQRRRKPIRAGQLAMWL